MKSSVPVLWVIVPPSRMSKLGFWCGEYFDRVLQVDRLRAVL